MSVAASKKKRSQNAQLAVDKYDALLTKFDWSKSTAWHGIAILLLACEVWETGGWKPFHGTIVYRERNDFKVGPHGPNAVMLRAEQLTTYLAKELGISRANVCGVIGQYWRDPSLASLQPNNLVGHAFRSQVVNILEKFGDSDINYEEEADVGEEFRGHHFQTRSKESKIDIMARRDGRPVALISTRWRFRHDRVDVVDEALAYGPAARRANPKCVFYAVLGEFAPNRLEKVLSNCPPKMPKAEITATVHFAPNLIREGLGENGRLSELKDLAWLIDQTFSWR